MSRIEKRFNCVRMKRDIKNRRAQAVLPRKPEDRAVEMARKIASGPFADLWKPGKRAPSHDYRAA